MKKSFYLSSLLVFCFLLSAVASRAQAPVITTNPHDTTVCSGSLAPFVTKSTGATSKMWQVWNAAATSWDTVHNGGIYTGATADTLRIVTSLAVNGKQYRSIVFNTSGSDTSNTATLTVDTLNVGGIVGPNMICLGSTVTLTDSIPGGTWSRLHPAIDTITATGEVTGLAFGWDTVRYTVTTVACGSGFASFPIRVDTSITAKPISGPAVTCIGGTILMTNPNVLGIHTWSVTNGNASITSSGFLTGVAAGFDTVIYTIKNGCDSVSSSFEVQIDAPLPAGTITGPTAVCFGSSIHLTSSVSGGIWVSSNTAVANVDGVGNVTGISQGTAVISYLRSNGCGSFVTSLNVTVSIPAGPITGIDSVGLGATRTLSNAAIGGSWSISDTTASDTVATISSAGVVTGLHIGTATVTYTVINVCGTTSSTVVMHVGTPPFAGAISAVRDTVCVGGTLALSNTTAGGPGVWSMTNARATVDAATGIVTGITKGKDTAIYTVTTGFGTSTTRKTINVYSSKVDSVKGPGTVAIGGTYQMLGFPAGGKWTSNNDTAAVIVSPTSGFFVVVNYGTAIFTYTIHNALCGDSSMNYTFSFINHAGVSAVNNADGNLKVFPNPANGSFTFNLSADMTAPVSVVITNVVGAKVKEFTTTTNQATAVELHQPAGMYIITASTDAGTYTSKVMIAE